MGEIGAPVEAMDTVGERVAGVEIGGDGGTDRATGDGAFAGTSLHDHERFADIEAEGCVKGHGSAVKGGLHEAKARRTAFARAIDDGLHQLAAQAVVLCGGVDRDGANSVDDGAFVEAIRTENPLLQFSDNAVEAGSAEEIADEPESLFRAGEVAREIVRGVDACKGVVANPGAVGDILGCGATSGETESIAGDQGGTLDERLRSQMRCGAAGKLTLTAFSESLSTFQILDRLPLPAGRVNSAIRLWSRASQKMH